MAKSCRPDAGKTSACLSEPDLQRDRSSRCSNTLRCVHEFGKISAERSREARRFAFRYCHTLHSFAGDILVLIYPLCWCTLRRRSRRALGSSSCLLSGDSEGRIGGFWCVCRSSLTIYVFLKAFTQMLACCKSRKTLRWQTPRPKQNSMGCRGPGHLARLKLTQQSKVTQRESSCTTQPRKYSSLFFQHDSKRLSATNFER